MVNALLGTKSYMTQAFTSDGRRMFVSVVKIGENIVTQIKTQNHDGYNSLQLGLGTKKAKHTSKPLQGHLSKAISNFKFKISNYPRYLREVRVSDQLPVDSDQLSVGKIIRAMDVFKVGDLVKVTGTSKGKGFAGVVKRHGFSGGPKTHGQSDRHRAPGSIGQGTTPGRVYKGKRMAGHMGMDRSTIRNLMVLKVEDDSIWLSGPVPGNRESLLIVERTGTAAKTPELYKEQVTQVEQVNQVEQVIGELGNQGEKTEESKKETKEQEEDKTN